MTDENEYETVSIKRKLKRRIEALGEKSESWSDLLERLIFKKRGEC
jgi:predicted CopG family antitoxin